MIGAAFPMPAFGKAIPRTITAGYGFRRRFFIPSEIHALSLADGSMVVPFLETQTWLRTVANGGKVQSASGFDIRFETDSGAKLPHDLASYVGSTGRIEAWIRVSAQTQDITAAILYGNASQATAEANPSATWAGFYWSLDVASGLDASSSAAHVDNTDVSTTTLLGMDAGSFVA